MQRWPLLLSLFVLASILAFFSRQLWIASLLEHFRHLYFGLGIVSLIAVGVRYIRHRHFYKWPLLLSTLLVFLNIGFFSSSIRSSIPTSPALKLLVHNIHRENNAYEEYAQFIQHESPNLVAFFEVTPVFIDKMQSGLKPYPFRWMHPSEDNYGMALWSKEVVTNLRPIEEDGIVTAVTFSLASSKTLFVLVHWPPPIFPDLWKIQQRTAQRILTLIRQSSVPIILAGDFNNTPWSAILLDLITQSRLLRITPASFFDFHTWPANVLGPFGLPVDHVFSNQPVSIRITPRFSSDHNGTMIYIPR